MNKVILAVAVAATLATPAMAADLSSRRGVPDAVYSPAIAPAGVWTGFYVGAHLGLGFGTRFNNDLGYNLGGASGAFGGIQAGYDYQINRFVLGGVADLSYGGINRRYVTTAPLDIRASQNWSGSLRGRLGYVVQDNLLLYGTAGLALGNVRAYEASPLVVSQTRTLVGWTAGVGGEYQFTRNISGLLEYRYTGLPRADYTTIVGAPRIGFEGHQIRTGVNYRF